ncbi:MAG: Gfo/Idh/MocA family oxidoreductase [Verrucomicrobia bacterium]|nr:Gfo/Idh/MocA family oxidoreductase [Verrucomicrobiota bacterium]
MKQPDSSTTTPLPSGTSSRRQFLRSSAFAGIGVSTLGLSGLRAAPANSKLRVLSIGVIGTIGGTDRKAVASHPMAEIVGLCDVDSNQLARAAKDHPDAFTCADYREAFAKHADKFDAVIVSVPDHSHAPIMLTALGHDKHVYGQKPLVHQLAEIGMMERAVAAKPHLVTQLGDQRMALPGRRAAVEILRAGTLGKAIESYNWTGSPNPGKYFNYEKVFTEPQTPPANLDWNLWQGPVAEAPYRGLLAPVKWRSWWDYGTNGLGDWGCHILDVLMFGYDELKDPFSVKTDCKEPASEHFHVTPCKSTIMYNVASDKFTDKTFPVHYWDAGQVPSPDQLRIGEQINGGNRTAIICEKGTLVLEGDGKLEIWRDGKMTPGLSEPGLPPFPRLNHWHAWVDNCLGIKTELRSPFKDAVRITEPCLLAVKATRFPGETLLWDKAKLTFTNNKKATDTIVSRDYRDGFAPPKVG